MQDAASNGDQAAARWGRSVGSALYVCLLSYLVGVGLWSVPPQVYGTSRGVAVDEASCRAAMEAAVDAVIAAAMRRATHAGAAETASAVASDAPTPPDASSGVRRRVERASEVCDAARARALRRLADDLDAAAARFERAARADVARGSASGRGTVP
ncbi:MAG: hypothetical protein NZ898_09265 [Myxococcota bacterium]|nr:hypothetical protein [Myxococcota bacterium]MDW8361634.1 hypothetical protein [Myxococcales bacterium]